MTKVTLCTSKLDDPIIDENSITFVEHITERDAERNEKHENVYLDDVIKEYDETTIINKDGITYNGELYKWDINKKLLNRKLNIEKIDDKIVFNFSKTNIFVKKNISFMLSKKCVKYTTSKKYKIFCVTITSKDYWEISINPLFSTFGRYICNIFSGNEGPYLLEGF